MRRRRLPLPDELRAKVFNNIAVEESVSTFDQTGSGQVTQPLNVEKGERSPGLRHSKDASIISATNNQSPKH